MILEAGAGFLRGASSRFCCRGGSDNREMCKRKAGCVVSCVSLKSLLVIFHTQRYHNILNYLSSQRRLFGLPHSVHLKRPSPSLVSTGLCTETREEVLSSLSPRVSALKKPLDSSTFGGIGRDNPLPSSSRLGSDGDIRSIVGNGIAAYLGSPCHP
jgi:hypothetical protein